MGQSVIPVTLAGSMAICPSEMMIPRYSMVVCAKTHFSGLRYRSCCRRRARTVWVKLSSRSGSLAKIRMSSRYIMTCPPSMRSANAVFMNVWKVAGALQRPKVMTVGSKSPRGVLKAALCSSPFLTRMLLYPHRMSSLVKYRAPCSLSMSSGIRGRGAAFLIVMLFSAQ